MKQIIEVVAALLWQENLFFIAQRPNDKDLGGLWEFPGGKVESGETYQEALVRECEEELDVFVEVGTLFMDVTHDYGTKIIKLSLFHCNLLQGTPRLLEHQDMQWITPEQISNFKFCPADLPFLERLGNQ